MKLTTENAQIVTVSVEIQALTVSGKQVTLAVFRQLQEEDVINWDTLEVKGKVWGRVNYHTDNCKDEVKHLHLVWQTGLELRRAEIYEPVIAYIQQHHRLKEEVWRLGVAFLLAGVIEGKIAFDFDVYHDSFSHTLKFEDGGVKTFRLTSKECANLRISRSERGLLWGKETREKVQAELAKVPPLAEIVPELLEARKALVTYEAKWEKLYGGFLQTPQLFIAV